MDTCVGSCELSNEGFSCGQLVGISVGHEVDLLWWCWRRKSSVSRTPTGSRSGVDVYFIYTRLI